VKVVHWFSHSVDQEDDPLAWLIEGITSEQEEQMAQRTAKRFLESIRTGERSGLGDYWFYAVTLSGAAGRVMVRDWIEGRFGELAENINKWFEDFEIVRRDGSGLAPNPQICRHTSVIGFDSGDGEVPAPLISKLWKSAVQGAPIPREALAQAVYTARSRFIEGETVDSVLIGLMKAYQIEKKEG
jgi:CRISPR-associated protein Csd1